jgi:hypothetical protein
MCNKRVWFGDLMHVKAASLPFCHNVMRAIFAQWGEKLARHRQLFGKRSAKVDLTAYYL